MLVDWTEVIRLMTEGGYPAGDWIEKIAFDDLSVRLRAFHRQEQVKVLIDVAGTIRPGADPRRTNSIDWRRRPRHAASGNAAQAG